MNWVDAAVDDIAGFSVVVAGGAAGGAAVCARAKPVERAVAASAAAKLVVRIHTSLRLPRRAALGWRTAKRGNRCNEPLQRPSCGTNGSAHASCCRMKPRRRLSLGNVAEREAVPPIPPPAWRKLVQVSGALRGRGGP